MTDDKKAKPKEKALKEKVEAPVKDKAAEAPAEVTTEAKPDASKNYNRGEGQKAVTQAYKDNWNAIYGKKKR